MISKLLREIREAKEAKEQGIINDEEFNFLKDQALSRLLPEGQEFYSGNLERAMTEDSPQESQTSFSDFVLVNALEEAEEELNLIENCLFENFRDIYLDNDKTIAEIAVNLLEDFDLIRLQVQALTDLLIEKYPGSFDSVGQEPVPVAMKILKELESESELEPERGKPGREFDKPSDPRKDPNDPSNLAAGILDSLKREENADNLGPKDIKDKSPKEEKTEVEKKRAHILFGLGPEDIELKPFPNVRPAAKPNTVGPLDNRQMGKLAEYLEDIGYGGPGVDPVATAIHLLERSGFDSTGQGQQPKYDFDIADFEEVKEQIGRYDYISNTRGLSNNLKIEGILSAEDFQILADHLRAVAGDQE